MPSPYPLLLEPVLLPKVWGGHRLAAHFGRRGESIGEAWLVADMPSTSVSGAGGHAIRSVIRNGAMRGRTLRDAWREWAGDLLGAGGAPSDDDPFPLLLKLLDADQHLSVQVHPSPAYAAAHADAHLKHESWFVLDVEGDATLFVGLTPGSDRDAIADAVHHGTVTEHLVSVAAKPGLCATLPSGLVHALGSGCLVLEAQSPSDTTYRLDDWGRDGREMHIREALAAMDAQLRPEIASGDTGQIARTDAFEMRRLKPGESCSHACAVAVTAPARTVEVIAGEHVSELQTWETVLLPAAFVQDFRVEGGDAIATLITP